MGRIAFIAALFLGIVSAICPERVWDGHVERQLEEDRWVQMTNDQKVQYMAKTFDDTARVMLDEGETQWRLHLHQHHTRFRAVNDFDRQHDEGRIAQQVANLYPASFANRSRLLRELKVCKHRGVEELLAEANRRRA